MKSIGPVLHPSICDMWDSAIPKLVQYIEANTDDFKQQAWEDLILRCVAVYNAGRDAIYRYPHHG